MRAGRAPLRIGTVSLLPSARQLTVLDLVVHGDHLDGAGGYARVAADAALWVEEENAAVWVQHPGERVGGTRPRADRTQDAAISHARQPERHGRLQRNVSYLQQAQGALMLDGRLDPVTCRRWLWRRQDAFERGQHVTGCLLDALHASTEERTPAEAVARVALIEAGQLFNLHLELAPPRQA